MGISPPARVAYAQQTPSPNLNEAFDLFVLIARQHPLLGPDHVQVLAIASDLLQDGRRLGCNRCLDTRRIQTQQAESLGIVIVHVVECDLTNTVSHHFQH